ncbi:MAG: YsnF/AvaK domain-containing protein [Chloroflexi bacterium]|nr:YsnF/AvaK domain-containing protein [Chloroflexota bacterium]
MPNEPLRDYPGSTRARAAHEINTHADRLASETPDGEAELDSADAERTLELREEQLVARKDLRELGEIEVRTEVDEVPGRLEVDAYREEVVIEHEAVGQVVSERDKPWEEEGVLVIPVYEEQVVVTKRLVLRERLRVRRVGTTERQLFQDTLRRERLVVEDPQHTGLVREQYPLGEPRGATDEEDLDGEDSEGSERGEPKNSPLGNLLRKVLE